MIGCWDCNWVGEVGDLIDGKCPECDSDDVSEIEDEGEENV